MIKIIKPKKRRDYVDFTVKKRMTYLSVINQGVKSFSLKFMLCGYGIKISGYSLLIATLWAAYFTVAFVDGFIGVNNIIQAPQIVYIPMAIIGGFISLVCISIIMTILNFIVNLPNYIMINK